MLESITPLILTFNEAPNITRTLEQLTWAHRIVLIDSFSTDETLAIAAKFPQIDLFQRSFDSFAEQCNFGLSKIESEWVLSIDADYICSPELILEMSTSTKETSVDGYFVPFKYSVFGKPLRGTLLPARQVLYRARKAHYRDDGHAHQVIVHGCSKRLSSYIYHDDRKPLSRWLWAQDRYMLIEVKKLLETVEHELSWGDRIRKLKIFAPFIILFYCLILKGGILDGWRGWYYAFQRVLAEIILAVRLIEAENLSSESQ